MSEKELIDKTNEVISELVYDKIELQKAYDYYNGKRDPEKFRYLEENFGIGNSTSIEFTPLLKKHVDALVGEFLGTPILPKVTCKDENTISNIMREKQLAITNGIVQFLNSHLHNAVLQMIQGKDNTDVAIKQQLDKIIENLNESFVSQYEIAAQNIIQYIMQSRTVDLVTKLRQLLTDLLITGYTFYRVIPSAGGNNIEIEVLNPLNTFIDRNPESPYVKNSYRVVVRKWMSKSQILAHFKNELSKDDIQSLKDKWKYDDSPSRYRTTSQITIEEDYSEDYTIPGYPDGQFYNYRLIPVYEVEWLETDKDLVMQRYNTIRIGQDIYILRGKDKNVTRSQSDPNVCGLSVNGVYFLNRSNTPYSLILKCAHLQDKYDLLIYYRDNLIANSGVAGNIVDVSMIPKFFGKELTERIMKFNAYVKQGTMMIDSSQEGRQGEGQAPNQIYNGYDNTLKTQAVQAIETAIQSIEQTVSSITGVFRERLNGIEQRDAVSNIKQGVNNSFTITKHYFQQMDLITCELLLDGLNLAKKVWKKGLTGTLILGEQLQQVFTALPEHYTLTDFDIHIVSTTEVMQDLQTLKQLVPDLVKSNLSDPDILLEVLTAKSLSDCKYKIKQALLKKKAENDQLQQLSQKLEESQQQLQQMQQELQKAQQKIEQLDEQRMQLEQNKIQLQYQVDWYKNQTDRQYKTKMADNDTKRVEIELAQLHDGNPYNDKIKE